MDGKNIINHGHIKYDDIYYATELLLTSDSVKETAKKYFDYYRSHGAPFPCEENLPKKKLLKWETVIKEKGLDDWSERFSNDFYKYTGNRKRLLASLLSRIIFNSNDLLKVPTYSIHTDKSGIDIRILPGFTKEDMNELWKHIVIFMPEINATIDRDVQRKHFLRNMQIYKIYLKCCRINPELEKKSWEDRYICIQNDPEYVNVDNSNPNTYKLNSDQVKYAIEESATFFANNPYLEQNIIFNL